MGSFPIRLLANRKQEDPSAFHPAYFRHFLSVSLKHSSFINLNEKSETFIASPRNRSENSTRDKFIPISFFDTVFHQIGSGMNTVPNLTSGSNANQDLP
jgi:hypothetical protein